MQNRVYLKLSSCFTHIMFLVPSHRPHRQLSSTPLGAPSSPHPSVLFQDESPFFEDLVPPGKCWQVLDRFDIAQVDHWCRPTPNTIPNPPLTTPPTGRGPPFVLPKFLPNPFTGIVPNTSIVILPERLPAGRRLTIDPATGSATETEIGHGYLEIGSRAMRLDGMGADMEDAAETETETGTGNDLVESDLSDLSLSTTHRGLKAKTSTPTARPTTRPPTLKPTPPVPTAAPTLQGIQPAGLYQNTFQYVVPTFGVQSRDIQHTLLITQIFADDPSTLVIGSQPFDLTAFTPAQATNIILAIRPTALNWTQTFSVPFEVTRSIQQDALTIVTTLVPTGSTTTTAAVAVINPSVLQILNPDTCTA